MTDAAPCPERRHDSEAGDRKTVPAVDDQTIDKVKVMAAELGHPPARREWDNHPDRGLSSSRLMRMHGGWKPILEAAGFQYGRGGDRSIPKQEIIEAIQDVAADMGYLPRVREWKSLPEGGPLAMRTIENTFGTYSRAAVAAGFVAPQRGGTQPERPPKSAEEAEIVAALLDYLAKERRTPTKRTWLSERRTPATWRIDTVFGSWGRAMHAAMLEPKRGADKEIPEEDILRILRLDHARLGRWPSAPEWREAQDGRPNINTLIQRFGSWDNARQKARLYEPGSRDWGDGNLSPTSRATP